MCRVPAVFLFVTLLASVTFPEYSISQLNDREFVKAEIVKYEALRQKLHDQSEGAAPILKVALQEDVKRTESLVEALRYVEVHGLKLDDPGLGKLSFFQKVPVGSKILLPKPVVRTAARISTSRIERTRIVTAPTADEGQGGESASAAAHSVGVGHGEEVTLADHLVRGQTTIFDFFSEYCPPCRQISPLLEQLDKARSDLTVVKVDINRPGVAGIDWQSPVVRQYDLRSVPHFKVFAPDGSLQAEGPAGYAVVALLMEEAGIGK